MSHDDVSSRRAFRRAAARLVLGSCAFVLGAHVACSSSSSSADDVDGGLGDVDGAAAKVDAPASVEASATSDATADGESDASASVDATDDGDVDASASTDAAPPKQVVALAAGSDHSCALLGSGAVWCWGSNQFGQRGDGTFANAVNPTPSLIPVVPPAQAICAGDLHTCALTSSGDVWCWGLNQDMQLGHDSRPAAGLDVACTPSYQCNPTPSKVGGLTNVASISCRSYVTCATTAVGDVYCWGLNQSGVAGKDPGTGIDCKDGVGACNFTPIKVDGTAAGSFAVGEAHACAGAGNEVRCWGGNALAGLGLPADAVARPAPVKIDGLASPTARVAAGRYTSYAISTTGVVSAWGDDRYGQLMFLLDAGGSVPTPQMLPLTGVVDFAAGGSFACALTGSGIVCWGENRFGEVGMLPADAGGGTCGTFPCTPTPNAVALSGVTKIAAGYQHACALKQDNTVWCWGYNSDGQTGHAPSMDPVCLGASTHCNPTPMQVLGLP